MLHRALVISSSFPQPLVRRIRSASTRRAFSRGFSIPELLAVVVIIGILAAVASPLFINIMRDRRVNKASMEIVNIYRTARSRALGRGNAVLVQWSAAESKFRVRESFPQIRWDDEVIARSCRDTDFADPAQARMARATRPGVEWADLTVGAAPYELAQVQFRDDSGSPQVFSEICFTGRGRTFIRIAPVGAFVPMNGVSRLDITNSRTNLVRKVYIPPNGAARMAL